LKLVLSDIFPKDWTSLDPDVPVPLQQFWAYGYAIEASGGSAFQISIKDDAGNLIGIALGLKRKLFGLIRFNVILRGPRWVKRHDTKDNRLAFYRLLKSQYPKYRWRFMALLPEFDQTDPKASELKHMGLRQVMSGFSTAWIDLRPDEETLRQTLKSKWRNQLKKAEGEKIDISFGGRKPHQYSWLLERESEQRSSQRYQATPLGLVPDYVATSDDPIERVLSVSAIASKERIAGALFLIHGNAATYHIGWTGEKGRSFNAQNRVLWEAMLALKTRGIDFMDLGGVNTADLAGITRFKLGTGAEPTTLAGAYL